MVRPLLLILVNRLAPINLTLHLTPQKFLGEYKNRQTTSQSAFQEFKTETRRRMEKSTKLPETTTARTQVNLPDEVVLLIFSYLPVQALLRARRVSTQWKSVAEDPSLLYALLILSCPRLNNTISQKGWGIL